MASSDSWMLSLAIATSISQSLGVGPQATPSESRPTLLLIATKLGGRLGGVVIEEIGTYGALGSFKLEIHPFVDSTLDASPIWRSLKRFFLSFQE
jgi:hypothetical protein